MGRPRLTSYLTPAQACSHLQGLQTAQAWPQVARHLPILMGGGRGRLAWAMRNNGALKRGDGIIVRL